MSSPTPQSIIVVTGIAAFFSVFRFSIDIIATATGRAEENEKKIMESKKKSNSSASSVSLSGSTSSSVKASKNQQSTSLLSNVVNGNDDNDDDGGKDDDKRPPIQTALSYISIIIQVSFLIYFTTMTIITALNTNETLLFDEIPLGAMAIGTFFNLVVSIRDFKRTRFTSIHRLFYIIFTLMSTLANVFHVAFSSSQTTHNSSLEYVTMAIMIVYTTLAFVEGKVFLPTYIQASNKNGNEHGTSGVFKKKHLGRSILIILKPYFWPKATPNTSAWLNRTRAIMTWVCVASAKVCTVISPIFLGRASTALSRLEYESTTRNAIIYCSLQFAATFFKECQSLVYLRVAQAAFIQLSELSFYHIHSLSLDWHLKKKLGEVIRSMDRGILSCDTLMKYLFLWLVPAVAECILVCIIFATYFDYLPLGFAIFTFVFIYIIWTIVVTLWRKKFRKSVAKNDNNWHDICTDSFVNFETVKYFTAEKYEVERFSNSIKEFQNSSVSVQASLSFLNISQQILMQCCLATALVLAAYGIKKRNDCCLLQGCEETNSQCCSDLANEGLCGGMEVGDFVAVLTFTLNLFMPLNFLGSVYNAIVMAMVDLRNLSELLAEEPDLVDAPNAIDCPPINKEDPDIAVEFDNVAFRYPSQIEGQGLTGVSFKMKRGTTTAIVGSTGAGKTTISRLLFRFYDVTGGAVKVNGVDVREMKQKTLRDLIGVVPQSTSMFNDTLAVNIQYGKRNATMEELDKVAESAQLLNFIRSLPDGWDTVIGDRGLKLSGGEKQRTAIARCLLKDPPFVILDEATSALDTVTENSIQQALDALGSHRTCLVIAHRLGTIRHADNIVVLGDGIVLEQVRIHASCNNYSFVTAQTHLY